jgi:hypothetical protein
MMAPSGLGVIGEDEEEEGEIPPLPVPSKAEADNNRPTGGASGVSDLSVITEDGKEEEEGVSPLPSIKPVSTASPKGLLRNVVRTEILKKEEGPQMGNVVATLMNKAVHVNPGSEAPAADSAELSAMMDIIDKEGGEEKSSEGEWGTDSSFSSGEDDVYNPPPLNLKQSTYMQVYIHTWKNMLINFRSRMEGSGDNMLSFMQYFIFIAILATVLVLIGKINPDATDDVLVGTAYPLSTRGIKNVLLTPCNLPFPEKKKSAATLDLVFKHLHGWQPKCFTSNAEMENYASSDLNVGKVFAAISIENIDALASQSAAEVRYSIRVNSTAFSFIVKDELYDKSVAQHSIPTTAFKYFSSGFVGLQAATEQVFTYIKSPTTLRYDVQISAFPLPSFHDYTLFSAVLVAVPLCFLIFYSTIFAAALTNVLKEKESGVKAHLLRTGLSPTSYFLMWMITGYVHDFISFHPNG